MTDAIAIMKLALCVPEADRLLSADAVEKLDG